MKLSDVIAPAVELAETGYPVSPGLALILAEERAHLGQWESSKAIFFKDVRPLQAGERLVQKDLARSLELIGKQGPAALYEGAIGQKNVAEMAHQQIFNTNPHPKN